MSKRYVIIAPIKRAQGHQTYEVDAADEAEAIKKYNAGEATFICEELEVTTCEELEIEEK